MTQGVIDPQAPARNYVDVPDWVEDAWRSPDRRSTAADYPVPVRVVQDIAERGSDAGALVVLSEDARRIMGQYGPDVAAALHPSDSITLDPSRPGFCWHWHCARILHRAIDRWAAEAVQSLERPAPAGSETLLWSDTYPSEPGFYWLAWPWGRGRTNTCLVSVWRADCGLQVTQVTAGRGWTDTLGGLIGDAHAYRWSGPLEPPESSNEK